MGYGDEIIGSGFAKGLAAQGKRMAFGDGHQIRWTSRAEMIFRNNPNVAPPGTDPKSKDLVWKAHYAGNRCYNRQVGTERWEWIKQPENGIVPGELFIDAREIAWSKICVPGETARRMVLIEPNVPAFKNVRGNKSWPAERYDAVAKAIYKAGYFPVQITLGRPYGPGHEVKHAQKVPNPIDIRHSFALLRRALLYVGPEGGMHHAAAAFGLPAVVIFGGFISPDVTGYPTHTNIFKGGDACGSLTDCDHCREALLAISAEEVIEHALDILKQRST